MLSARRKISDYKIGDDNGDDILKVASLIADVMQVIQQALFIRRNQSVNKCEILQRTFK